MLIPFFKYALADQLYLALVLGFFWNLVFIYISTASPSFSELLSLTTQPGSLAVAPPQSWTTNTTLPKHTPRESLTASRRPIYSANNQPTRSSTTSPIFLLFTTVDHIHNGRPTHPTERGAPQNAGSKENTLQLQGCQASTPRRLKTHQRTWTPAVPIIRQPQPQPFSWRWEA